MQKRKVVLIDDEPVIIEGFRKLVDWESHGFTMDGTANDGVMALKVLEQVQPDLAIVDINIPLMSGLNVIGKAAPICPATKFVIISGYDDFSYVQQAIKLQAVDYILKPVDFDAFALFLDNLYVSLLGSAPADRIPDKGRSDTDDLIMSVIAYINNHLGDRITLKRLAGEFHMNSAYLSQFFKNKTGMNYYDYLTAQRVTRAKQLLLTTSRTITDISQEVGFSSYRVFSASFKKATGTSPSEYRIKQKNDIIV